MLTLRRGRRGRRWSPSIIQRVYTDQLVSALQAACSKSSLKFSNSHQRASGRTRPRRGAASEQRRPASSCPPGGTRQRIQKVCFQTDQTLTSVHTDLRVSEHRPLSSGWGRGTQPQGRWWSHQMHPRTLIQVQKHSSHYYTLCGKGRDLYSSHCTNLIITCCSSTWRSTTLTPYGLQAAHGHLQPLHQTRQLRHTCRERTQKRVRGEKSGQFTLIGTNTVSFSSGM